MKRSNIQMLAALGMLTALEIILSRFCSISAWNLKISLNFLPIAAAALRYGPAPAAAVAAAGDFVGAVLFPIGAYFPGFTLTAALTGALFGLLLHRHPSGGRVLAAAAIHQLVLSLLLNTLWISVLYASPFLPLLLTRVVQSLVMLPVQVLGLAALVRAMGRYGRRAAA